MNKRNGLNVFVGPRAILDYTDPGKHAPTSLVELPPGTEINPFLKKHKVRIFVKMMNECPGNTFKLVPVNEWFNRQKRLGRITKDTIVVINSSGGAGLAAVMKGMAMKVKKVVVYMPEDAPTEKHLLIERAGGELRKTKDKPGEPTSVEKVRKMARKKNHLVFDQYGDYANVDGHLKDTIAQIWRQFATLGTLPGLIVAARGTTGTLVAARDHCQMHSPRTICLGVACEKDEPIPAVRPESRLGPDQIRFDHWKGTRSEFVKRYPAYRKTLELLKYAGLKVGLSTGAALSGALQFISQFMEGPAITGARDGKGFLNVVVISGDILDPYLGQLRVILDDRDL